jgi:hypothetical protein
MDLQDRLSFEDLNARQRAGMTKHQKASPMTAAKITPIGGPTRAHRSRRLSPVDRSDLDAPVRAG